MFSRFKRSLSELVARRRVRREAAAQAFIDYVIASCTDKVQLACYLMAIGGTPKDPVKMAELIRSLRDGFAYGRYSFDAAIASAAA